VLNAERPLAEQIAAIEALVARQRAAPASA
jgi:hypothetical protein